jgi:diadenosine tetraphosphate (Ap4A) HIT family hydrolase
MGPLGTLFIESKRHFLDYGEMTDAESSSFGNVMRKMYQALKPHTAAERVYQVTMMDGVPHFHTWLVPRRHEDSAKGMKFLTMDIACSEEDAVALAHQLRETMSHT